MSDLFLRVGNDPHFKFLMSGVNGPMESIFVDTLARTHETDEETIQDCLAQERARAYGRPFESALSAIDILEGEWLALTKDGGERDPFATFITEPVWPTADPERQPSTDIELQLAALVSQVVTVHKLKETRALVGFSRLDPSNKLVPADLGKEGLVSQKRPAVEVFGEGIFIALAEEPLRKWESENAAVLAGHLSSIQDRADSSLIAGRFEAVTPRFVVLHTLAHMLIRELSYGSGYNAASMRERIYSRTEDEGASAFAGILIYTASGDSEGSLGGLARFGRLPRPWHLIEGALKHATVCSLDPVCGESRGQGYDALNLAACHACSLVPETSCVYSNSILDRGLLVGSERFEAGFFSDLMKLV